ncbi:hypothetical protein C7385_0572 [Acholeplasma laidlawii]|nr:hypothetical protein C7385_0572 [Acholeplasma laidlawii]SQH56856.1 Uncharacterised protein [Acholeplasma laidlawii]
MRNGNKATNKIKIYIVRFYYQGQVSEVFIWYLE